jgi:anaerobic glycerol-3-phosphate dehydrogenase
MSIAIVGAGVAGLSALVGARSAGASADVYSHRPGASRLVAGLWDVATDLARSPLDGRPIREDVARLAAERPAHPYARMTGAESAIVEAHERVLEELGGFPQFSLDSHGPLAVTDLGLARRAATIDRAIFDLAGVDRGIVAVLAFPFFRDHDARFIAASLNEILAERSDLRFVAIDVDFLSRRTDAILFPLEIAKLLDGPAARDRMVRDVTRAIAGHHLAGAIFPPLLGVETDLAAFLRDRLSLAVGEIATPLASVQAHRFSRASRAAIDRLAAAYREEEVIAVEAGERSVTVRTHAAEREYDAVVLASGKILSGGVVRDAEGFIEPLTRSRARATSPHAVGVDYDADLRLCDRDAVLSPRLFVAGTLLSGVDPRDGSGLGCAATTGYLAGKNAALAEARDHEALTAAR